jgi:hypothetical protein
MKESRMKDEDGRLRIEDRWMKEGQRRTQQQKSQRGVNDNDDNAEKHGCCEGVLCSCSKRVRHIQFISDGCMERCE